jgi:hypothetical protein
MVNPTSNINGNNTYLCHKIQSRLNNTLIQKCGGTVEAIPTSLFQLIQEYLKENDYRNL